MEEKEEHSSVLHNGSTEVMLRVCVSVWRGGKQTITTTTYVFSSLPPYSSLLYEFFEGREDGQKKKEANERRGETQEVYKFVSCFLSFFPLSSLLSMLPSGFHAQWTHTHTVVFVSTLQHPSQSKVFRCGLHVQLGCLSSPFT